MTVTRKLWAIGDIHGMYDHLLKLLDHIEKQGPAQIVFLGDFVDRGLKSREVLNLLMAGPRRPLDIWLPIMGNHEEMMLQSNSGMSRRVFWLQNGGEETNDSYPEGKVSEAHIEWVAKLPTWAETENHWFVHAGLYPGMNPSEHVSASIMWMRQWEEDYLEAEELLQTPPGKRRKYLGELDEMVIANGTPYVKHVVYGHTPRPDVFFGKYMTGIDTGACFGLKETARHDWKLTAAEFPRDRAEGPTQLAQVNSKGELHWTAITP